MEFSKDELKLPEERFGTLVKEEHSSALAIILGLLIIFLIVILGGLYLWSMYMAEPLPEPEVTVPESRPTAEENNEPESTNAEAEAETMSALSSSDEISVLEADIEGTLVDNVDADTAAVEAELAQ
jgi:hypothetical protein